MLSSKHIQRSRTNSTASNQSAQASRSPSPVSSLTTGSAEAELVIADINNTQEQLDALMMSLQDLPSTEIDSFDKPTLQARRLAKDDSSDIIYDPPIAPLSADLGESDPANYSGQKKGFIGQTVETVVKIARGMLRNRALRRQTIKSEHAAQNDTLLGMHNDIIRVLHGKQIESQATGASQAQSSQLFHDSYTSWIDRLNNSKDNEDHPALLLGCLRFLCQKKNQHLSFNELVVAFKRLAAPPPQVVIQHADLLALSESENSDTDSDTDTESDEDHDNKDTRQAP